MNKDWIAGLREKKAPVALAAFCVVAFVMILIGVFALHTPVVALCVLVMLEAGIAVMLHNVELWLHAVKVLAEIIIGIIVGRVWVVVLCAVVYIAATVALQVFRGDEQPKKVI